jgi:hypothetical protein
MEGHRIEVRSALATRMLSTCFFAAGVPLFTWAAVSRTPGSAFSQALGHVLFGAAALGCAFMTVRSIQSGHLEVSKSEIRFTRIRGMQSIEVADVDSVSSGPDYRGYVITPVLKLRSGRLIRLSDFGSASWSLRRHPTSCSCGRAMAALETAVHSDRADI